MQMTSPKHTFARAFTLVELLVVISIISVLFALILPSLTQARELTKQLNCAVKQRGVSQASFVYTNDWKGFGPPSTYNFGYRWNRETTSEYTNLGPADNVPSFEIGKTYPTSKGLMSYFGFDSNTPDNAKFYQRNKGCPDYSGSSIGASAGASYGANHYIMGLAATAVSSEPLRDYWLRFEDRRIKGPEIVLFFETYHGQWKDFAFVVEGRPGSPYFWAPRHKTGLNFIFADGHGKFVRMENGLFVEPLTAAVPGATR